MDLAPASALFGSLDVGPLERLLLMDVLLMVVVFQPGILTIYPVTSTDEAEYGQQIRDTMGTPGDVADGHWWVYRL